MPAKVRADLAAHLGAANSPTTMAYVERGYVEDGESEAFLRVLDVLAEWRRDGSP